MFEAELALVDGLTCDGGGFGEVNASIGKCGFLEARGGETLERSDAANGSDGGFGEWRGLLFQALQLIFARDLHDRPLDVVDGGILHRSPFQFHTAGGNDGGHAVVDGAWLRAELRWGRAGGGA